MNVIGEKTTKLEIQDDWAIVSGGNDMKLYHISSSTEQVDQAGNIRRGSNQLCMLRLAYVCYDLPYNRCIEWHPTLKGIVCLWYLGKIVIGEFLGLESSTAATNAGPSFHILGELSRSTRSCNIVSFCPFQPNILIVGFDKARNDSGLRFYNVENILAKRNIGGSVSDGLPLTDSSATIINQYGPSQGVHSACWLDKLFVVGMGFKWVRAYNLLDQTAGPVLSIATKSVLGLVADPFHTTRFASFSEDGFIRIWDSAVSLIEPLLIINSDFRQNLIDISFSPSKKGLLYAFARENSSIRFWQLDQSLSNSKEEVNRDILTDKEDSDKLNSAAESNSLKLEGISVLWTRTVKPKGDLHINCIQWLPKLHPSLLVCAGKDYQVFVYDIPASPVCSWSPSGQTSILLDSHVQQYNPSQSQNQISESDDVKKSQIYDIAKVMFDRAYKNYGLNCKTNIEMVKNDNHLQSAWKFLDFISSSSSSIFEIDGKDYRRLGLSTIVKNMPSSQARSLGSDLGFSLILYSSSYRKVGLSLCGWEYQDSFQETIQRLEYKGDFEKAAGMLFLYYGDLAKTIACLNSSGDERLILIAAALAGGLGSQSNLWKNLCKNLSYQLRDPFLRFLFGLISCDGDWSLVLNETSLSLEDRMLIALNFLDDSLLISFVSKWTEIVERHGRIDGLFLTGLNSKGIDLLERYVDRTGDCQSPALMISVAPFTTQLDDPRCESWIECYRDLLDRYELFHTRAKFDITRRKEGNLAIAPPQVFVKCNFCNQSVSYGTKPKKSHPLINYNNRQKASLCPNCMASLPRCSICMLQLGTTFDLNLSNQSLHSLLQKPIADGKLIPNSNLGSPSLFENWFAWCQSCHHGGHASHLFEWFLRNKACPVTNCPCNCQL